MKATITTKENYWESLIIPNESIEGQRQLYLLKELSPKKTQEELVKYRKKHQGNVFYPLSLPTFFELLFILYDLDTQTIQKTNRTTKQIKEFILSNLEEGILTTTTIETRKTIEESDKIVHIFNGQKIEIEGNFAGNNCYIDNLNLRSIESLLGIKKDGLCKLYNVCRWLIEKNNGCCVFIYRPNVAPTEHNINPVYVKFNKLNKLIEIVSGFPDQQKASLLVCQK